MKYLLYILLYYLSYFNKYFFINIENDNKSTKFNKYLHV